MKRLRWQALCLVVITVIAFWLRANHLGLVNLYNDEYYQFETAVGYLKTRQWARYDFYTGTVGAAYMRALPYTLQIAASMKLFGISERAARLPAVLWGTLLIPLTILLVWRLTRRPQLAYATGLILTFDDFMIGLSRYVRMYMMLAVCCLVIAAAVYAFAEARTRWRWWWFGLAGLAAAMAFSIFKELTLALFGAISVYVVVRALVYFIQRRPRDRSWAVLGVGTLALGLAAVIFEIVGYNVYPADAIIIRIEPHWTYLQQLYWNWRVPAVGFGLFAIGGLSQWRQRRSFVAYCVVLSLVVIGYFIFLSHRWDAQRYISFMIPFVTVVTATGFITGARFVWSVLPALRWVRIPLLVVFLVVAGPWLSFPGVPPLPGITQEALADQSATDVGYADTKAAYAYVVQQYQPGEVVLIQTPRFYYWSDLTIPVYKLGGYQRLSFTEFKQLAALGPHGGWMIYDFTHGRHLRDKIENFSDHRFTDIYQLNPTFVHVYHFTPKDLRHRRSTKK